MEKDNTMDKIKILCILHADFEAAGMIEDWSKKRGHAFSAVKPYRGEELPQDTDFDFLVVMGGPQSPLESEKYPYLNDEISFIQRAVEADKVIFGFCLGAQLVGEAFGAKTGKSPEKEIGVYPITLTEAGQKDPLFVDFPKTFPVIHWHNDMPGLTEKSDLLAYSEGCPRQVVRYGPKIYGLQCHLEISGVGIEKMHKALSNELSPSRFTQQKEEFLSQDYPLIHKYLNLILDRLQMMT